MTPPPFLAASPPSPPADLALRRALEHQIAALVPIAAALHVAVVHPPIAPADWHGPASSAYAALETRMRARVAEAERAVVATLQSSRLAIGELGG